MRCLAPMEAGTFASYCVRFIRCLAPLEVSCFASDCVRFIWCLAPLEPGKRRTLLATRGPPGAVPGTYGGWHFC